MIEETNDVPVANPMYLTMGIRSHSLAVSIVLACRQHAQKQLDECHANYLSKLPQSEEKREEWRAYQQQALKLVGWADELSLTVSLREREEEANQPPPVS